MGGISVTRATQSSRIIISKCFLCKSALLGSDIEKQWKHRRRSWKDFGNSNESQHERSVRACRLSVQNSAGDEINS
jgi:hypothetical protein